jgi:hypothetical protein
MKCRNSEYPAIGVTWRGLQEGQIPVYYSELKRDKQKIQIFSKRLFGCCKASKKEKKTVFYGTLMEISESPACKGTPAYV